MVIYLDKNQQSPVEAVAIRAGYSMGYGNNAAFYCAKLVDGRWVHFTKSHNPHVKVKVPRPPLSEFKRTTRGYIWDGPEIQLDEPA